MNLPFSVAANNLEIKTAGVAILNAFQGAKQ